MDPVSAFGSRRVILCNNFDFGADMADNRCMLHEAERKTGAATRQKRLQIRLPFIAICVLASALLMGCGKKSNMVLHVSPRANDGRPIYMMLRAVNEAAFIKDSYQDVAARVATPDESVLATEVLYPNTNRTIELSVPAKGKIAVYFFFTSPTGDWKLLLDNPPPKSTSIVVRDRRIVPP